MDNMMDIARIGNRVVVGTVEFTTVDVRHVQHPAGTSGERIGKIVTIAFRIINSLRSRTERHALWYDEAWQFVRMTDYHGPSNINSTLFGERA